MDNSVVVIGAGLSGVAAAVRLLEAGVRDFVVLERADSVGGTWRDAVYPGAEVDVPSWLYSFSFAPNPDWSYVNSPAPEIRAYIEDVVERFGVTPHLRFGADVTTAVFNKHDGRWRIRTRDGRLFTARAVIAADGLLANAQYPNIPGVESFAGQKMLSASWVDGYDFTDKKVAVVGTGASAVQIVPELVKLAGHLTVFQRSPAWVLPRSSVKVPAALKRTFRRFPVVQSAARGVLFNIYELLILALVKLTPLTKVVETAAKVHLRAAVKDRALRRVLTPHYRVGCKRPLVTSQFYPALQQPNATLVPHGVTEITATGLRTADGAEHELDCIVFATGYDAGARGSAFTVVGLDGRVLGDEWSNGMVGYKSANTAGFPNLFWTMGPNSFAHSSNLLFIEEQIRYALLGIKRMLADDILVLDVKPEAQAAYNTEIQRRLQHTTFNSGCHSWYLADSGHNGMMYPGSVREFRRQMADLELQDYSVFTAADAGAAGTELTANTGMA